MVDPHSTERLESSGSQRDETILRLYVHGTPVADIAELTGVCVKTVRNVARRRGFPPRRASQPDRDAAALKRYIAGERSTALTRELGISRTHLHSLRAGAGVPLQAGLRRRYPLDETAFEHPTEIGWWLIGLLAADGSINEREHRVSLCQTLADQDVLHEFLRYVGCPERPLTMLNLSPAAQARQLPRRPAAEARIFSARVCASLALHGIVPRKTANLELSGNAAGRAAVWLGLLDGDGSVGLYNDGRTPQIEFTGTRALMAQCEAFWRKALGYSELRPAASHHSRRLWSFRLTCSKAVVAAPILLEASPVSMVRKRSVLEQVAAKSRMNDAYGRNPS
jgi:hypothetical protein